MRILLYLVFISVPIELAFAQDATYPIHPDSVVNEEMPHGQVKGPFEFKSKVYPGTTRNYWLYVPAQYDPNSPACTFIVQDGLGRAEGWKLPTVMDNLIADGSMPTTIGIFVDHGQVVPDHPNAQPRFNRSFEYDSVGPRYSRFLLDELLPEIRQTYNLSEDPNDNSIGGASSGAVCAFNVAWERPDKFRRVLSTIGTYVGLRGANEFPTLIRKCEPKPIRVFLQDGSNDLDIYGGDWWMANQSMLSALEYAGYEVNHRWGKGGHNGNHSTAIMPDALRWLWKDYGTEIQRGQFRDPRIEVLVDGEGWEKVDIGFHGVAGLAPSQNVGVVTFDIPGKRLIEVIANENLPSAKVSTLQENAHEFEIARRLPIGNVQQTGDGIESTLTDVRNAGQEARLWTHSGLFQNERGEQIKFTSRSHIKNPPEKLPSNRPTSRSTFVALQISPDASRLFGCRLNDRFITVLDLDDENQIVSRQQFGYLHLPANVGESGACSMVCDTLGNLYVATTVGIQILDPLGRVNLILEKPNSGELTNICFSGPNRQTLYVICGGGLFRRPAKTTGYHSWTSPIQTPRPGL